uniref:Uncharacterized protein n=1 Tax=Plectus sambesii TaxID=2011161 RepID=A0A914XBF0_9BILA
MQNTMPDGRVEGASGSLSSSPPSVAPPPSFRPLSSLVQIHSATRKPPPRSRAALASESRMGPRTKANSDGTTQTTACSLFFDGSTTTTTTRR